MSVSRAKTVEWLKRFHLHAFSRQVSRLDFLSNFRVEWKFKFIEIIHIIRFFHRIQDEDTPQYPASELNSHGPSVLGWRSKPDEKNEKVTKEIVLKFQYPAKIYKIQVLAHQFMIREFEGRDKFLQFLVFCF